MADPNDRERRADMPRGPLGDARPDAAMPKKEGDPGLPDPRTRGGQPQEDVENRGTVGSVRPEDYPEKDRADASPNKND